MTPDPHTTEPPTFARMRKTRDDTLAAKAREHDEDGQNAPCVRLNFFSSRTFSLEPYLNRALTCLHHHNVPAKTTLHISTCTHITRSQQPSNSREIQLLGEPPPPPRSKPAFVRGQVVPVEIIHARVTWWLRCVDVGPPSPPPATSSSVTVIPAAPSTTGPVVVEPSLPFGLAGGCFLQVGFGGTCPRISGDRR